MNTSEKSIDPIETPTVRQTTGNGGDSFEQQHFLTMEGTQQPKQFTESTFIDLKCEQFISF